MPSQVDRFHVYVPNTTLCRPSGVLLRRQVQRAPIKAENRLDTARSARIGDRDWYVDKKAIAGAENLERRGPAENVLVHEEVETAAATKVETQAGTIMRTAFQGAGLGEIVA